MAVFRIERTRDYTVMSNHHLRDKALSLKSKGLLSMMLSLPEDWNYTTRGLAKICKEGVDAIGGALRELEAAGYIVRHQMRDRQGRISDTEYVYWVTHVCSVTATDTNVSVWSNGYRFATECTIHPLPYLETFDSVAGSAYNADGILPDCWRAYSNGTNSAYMPHVVGSGSYLPLR